MPFFQTPPTQDEWEHQRLRIKKLYIDEGKTLKEVMDTMAREHSFRATSVRSFIVCPEPS
jgi:hypothetical protein